MIATALIAAIGKAATFAHGRDLMAPSGFVPNCDAAHKALRLVWESVLCGDAGFA
jgi:hypothetical protein